MSSPDDIKAEIDETRESLRSDVEALQSKIDPKQRADDIVSRLAEVTREEPARAGAVAFVAGWTVAWLVAR